MENKDIKLENLSVLEADICSAKSADVVEVNSNIVEPRLEIKEKIGQTVSFSNDTACQDNVDEIQLSEEEKLFFNNLNKRKDYLNLEAINEYQRLWKKNEIKEREVKAKQFRKKVWEKITSPWQTIKDTVKCVGSFVERIIPSAAKYQDLQSMHDRQQENLYQKYKSDKLDLDCLSDLECKFIEENSRIPDDYSELLAFKGVKANELKVKYDEEWNFIETDRNSNEHKQILNDTINKSTYLRFKQNPGKTIFNGLESIKKSYNESWLNKPVPSFSKFNKTEVTWNNLKAFVAGDESKYTYPKPKSSRKFAAYYNEENTNSGVVAPVAPKPIRKIEKKSTSSAWGRGLAVAGIALAAAFGFFYKKNQKTENANTYNQAAMVVDNSTDENATKSLEVNEIKKAETSENDNLESAGQSPAPKPEAVTVKKVASHSNVGSQRRVEKPAAKPVIKEQKADAANEAEEKRLKSAQELLLEVEELKLKESWKIRIANLKAKMVNPGYVQPTVPTGFSPYDNGMITSTNLKGIPQEESYESHIAIVERIIEKNDLTQEDVNNAEKALNSSENRMTNNIIAENEARYMNAFNIHMTNARAKLKGLRQRAVQQLFRGETDNENMYVIKYANGKKGVIDLNKLAVEIENLPTKANFQNNAWGEWSCAYAKWFTDTKIPTVK